MRYRWLRVRHGVVLRGELDEWLSVGVCALRLLRIPLLAVWDWAWRPLAQRLTGSTWWVVEVRFHEQDAEFVRLAGAPDRSAAEQRRRDIQQAQD
jgi:hypothetical protein